MKLARKFQNITMIKFKWAHLQKTARCDTSGTLACGILSHPLPPDDDPISDGYKVQNRPRNNVQVRNNDACHCKCPKDPPKYLPRTVESARTRPNEHQAQQARNRVYNIWHKWYGSYVRDLHHKKEGGNSMWSGSKGYEVNFE